MIRLPQAPAAAATATAAAVGLLLSGCATTTADTGPDAGPDARPTADAAPRTDTGAAGRESVPTGGETAALAATFRFMFAENASALKSNAATYCIGTGTSGSLNNPNPELMAALADVRPAVAPASSCKVDDRVMDAQGRPSLLFSLRTIECDGLDNCVFEGGYYEGNVSASSGRYRARFVNDAWQATPEDPQAVS